MLFQSGRTLAFVLAIPQQALLRLLGEPQTLLWAVVGYLTWSDQLAAVGSVERVRQWATDTVGGPSR
ncbi:hypothetical protein [Haloarchaeobius iranensis]|uniref:Uncharacterized protein n=1 Tax=Haloarchaeobius iranensis TaxID=996166 RepID=A0A1H0AAI1_9EURY|nr:hypothetical protein [Haloarchaeobius iranensis]SDN29716.1 hypothetical protein SAMN05192554_12536 [Haloarchaeobius iranensis]